MPLNFCEIIDVCHGDPLLPLRTPLTAGTGILLDLVVAASLLCHVKCFELFLLLLANRASLSLPGSDCFGCSLQVD